MKKITLIFALVVNTTCVFSQHSHRAYRELADSLYKYHNYKDAAFYYERAIKNAPDSARMMLHIAKAYSEINSVKESEVWYEKAIAQHATFSAEDTYNFVKDLLKLQRRRDAEATLRKFLKEHPDDDYAQSLLTEILRVETYFADSSLCTIRSLPVINTPAAEFAPIFYADGLVFTTARSQSTSKKKYHLDKSYFLNLYYSARGTDGQLQKPAPFGKEISSNLHTGPASFYQKDQRMILNRNLESRMKGSTDVYISHLALFDAMRDTQKNAWSILPLPFADSAYSFAHPSISEDGNTLYFSSDKPGGYGGMDLYVSFRHNDQWSAPLNLGQVVNTPENEAFPFYIDNTLYFASDGHGGLGGLDLFKTIRTPNGFSLPVNLGYPLNSHLDDFALITKDHQHGYFSSSRGGNDDLFEFHKKVKPVKMLVRVHDGVTSVSIPGSEVEVITDVKDFVLVSGNGGNLAFEVATESPYMLVARKDGKTGVLTGIAASSEDNDHIVHDLPIFGDSLSVPCVGVLKDETGLVQNAEEVHVFDETSGEPVTGTSNMSMVYFAGKRGHRYRVVVKSAQGNIVEKTVDIEDDIRGTKMWSIETKTGAASVALQVKVLSEDTKTTIPNAKVVVATLDSQDQILVADETGTVRAEIPRDAPYLITASNDRAAGMQSGFADVAYDQHAKMDTVFLKNGFDAPVHGMILITNAQGETMKGADVTIINHTTGDSTFQRIENGVANFSGQPGQTYTVRVKSKGYTDAEKRVITVGGTTEKVQVVMHEEEPADHTVTARIQGKDGMPVAGADVNVTTLSDQNSTLTSNGEGTVSFTVPEGEGYIVTAQKNTQSGLYTGVSGKNDDTLSAIHPITIAAKPDSMQVFGIITDQEGAVVRHAIVEVTDTLTSEKIPATLENGILSFPTKPGGGYKVVVSAENYSSEQRIVGTNESNSLGQLSTIRLRKTIPVTVKIGDSQCVVIKDATAIVKDAITGEEIASDMKDGVLTFSSEQGGHYNITVTHPDHGEASEEIIVPRLAESVTPRFISFPSKGQQSSFNILARVLMATDSLPVNEASVTITSFVTDDLTITTAKEGLVEFKLTAGAPFMIVASKGEYSGMYTGISENSKIPEVHPVVIQAGPKDRLMALTMVSDEHGIPVAAADVIVTDVGTGEKVNAKLENGFLGFSGKKGADYSIEIKAPGYQTTTQTLSIKASDKNVTPLRITLRQLKTEQLRESLKIVLQSDSTLVSNATVKVISFSSDDMELLSNEQGLVEFSLPADAAYMAVASKDGYFGSYTGELPGTQQATIHTVVMDKENTSQLPVLGLLADSDGRPVSSAKVTVIDNQTDASVEVQLNRGLLAFVGKKGGDYRIEVISDEFETQTENIKISQDATKPHEIEITFKRRKLLVLPETSSLVVVNNDPPRVYITGVDTHGEIVDEGGLLYLKNTDGKRLLGPGSWKALLENPDRLIEMSGNQMTKLDNIYFDFNSTFLDESDRAILDATKKLMVQYPLLHLAVNTHADTRGSSHYNLQLTRRRAKAVKHYLVKQGVKARRIEARAYGKSTPAVICATPECTEEQHQKNRRAEFELATLPKKAIQPMEITKSKAVVLTSSAKARVSRSYAALLTKYGSRQKEGLVFKVCIGGYRLNPNLTFQEFTDLGTVERQERNGINYYYLQNFQSLQAAEDVRQRVIMRGSVTRTLRSSTIARKYRSPGLYRSQNDVRCLVCT